MARPLVRLFKRTSRRTKGKAKDAGETKTFWYAVRFVDLNDKRRVMALDTASERKAREMLPYIQRLVDALEDNRPIDRPTEEWLAQIDEPLRAKLREFGLIGQRGSATLGGLLASYIDSRTDVKESTVVNWRHTARCLLEHFGPERLLASITPADAAAFERYLKGDARMHAYAGRDKKDPLAMATLRKRISNAKQFFNEAIERELIVKNPFAKLKSAVHANRARDFFITRDMADKVFAVLPDYEWRLLFALSRYGGLRCPSEHLALRWADVDLEAGRMIVHSPKTEHHANGAMRAMPIFPELRSYLQDAFDAAAIDGQVLGS